MKIVYGMWCTTETVSEWYEGQSKVCLRCRNFDKSLNTYSNVTILKCLQRITIPSMPFENVSVDVKLRQSSFHISLKFCENNELGMTVARRIIIYSIHSCETIQRRWQRNKNEGGVSLCLEDSSYKNGGFFKIWSRPLIMNLTKTLNGRLVSFMRCCRHCLRFPTNPHQPGNA